MFFEDLPDNLRQSAYPLIEELGTNEFAWAYEDVKQVVSYLADHHYAILGGDVLEKRQGRFEYTYDNWSHNRGERVEWDDYVVQCREKTQAYIDWYRGAFGDGYYYVPVPANESEWDELIALEKARQRARQERG